METERERDLKRVAELLDGAGPQGMTARQVSRATGLPFEYAGELLVDLVMATLEREQAGDKLN